MILTAAEHPITLTAADEVHDLRRPLLARSSGSPSKKQTVRPSSLRVGVLELSFRLTNECFVEPRFASCHPDQLSTNDKITIVKVKSDILARRQSLNMGCQSRYASPVAGRETPKKRIILTTVECPITLTTSVEAHDLSCPQLAQSLGPPSKEQTAKPFPRGVGFQELSFGKPMKYLYSHNLPASTLTR